MLKRQLIITVFILFAIHGICQEPKDTVPIPSDEALEIDTSFNYDELLNEMDLFLDSLLKPRSFLLASVSAGSNYYNYWKRNFTRLEAVKKAIFTPVLGYYHRSGPGLTLSGNITDDGKQWNLYQFSVTPSFDFIQSMNWTGGLSYTRYFTKDSLPFYTSPLQNEYNAYFIWRKSWIQPGITFTYGHGSRSDLRERERYVLLLRRKRLGSIVNTISTNEEVADFSVTGSLRHTFYIREVLSRKDYIKIVPQIAFSAGTQKFGFNRTSNTYLLNTREATNLLYNSGDISVDDELKFQPLSLALYLRPEYSIGKFFIQPQCILDYYFPSENFTAVFSINAGFVF
jgi:hypothetical protein